MARYARGVYGSAKYGLDLWSEYSVEPMVASITVDVPHFSTTSSFTDANYNADHSRVQVSWLVPTTVDHFQLLRSNLGFPTSPVDPFSSVLINDTPDAQPIVSPLPGDGQRTRRAYLDTSVEPGREYFYAVWVYVAAAGEWILAGRAQVTTSNDHATLDSLKAALPPYMWNHYSGPGDGVAVQEDDDDEDYMTRWLQACAWELDQSLTKVDLLREVWDPQRTPSALLDDAVRMFGLPVEPALGARSQRALLNNAAEITGERGSLNAITLLVESLTGFNCTLKIGKNQINNTDESSFEGLTVVPGGNTVASGLGRWFITNSTLTRVDGDIPPGSVQIARDANADDDFGPSTRFGLRLDAVSGSAPIELTLGARVQVTKYVADATYATVTTKWVHGLEAGDVIGVHLDATSITNVLVDGVVDDFNIRFNTLAVGGPTSTTITPTVGYIDGNCVIAYQGVPVDAGTIYALVGKFKAENRSDITLTVNYYDRDGNYISQVVATPSSAVPPTPWTDVYVAGSAPTGAAVCTLDIAMAARGSLTNFYMYVDSLMLALGGTPYEPSGPSGSWPVNYKVLNTNVVTITTSTDHTVLVGDHVDVSGLGAPFDTVTTLTPDTVTAVTHNTISYARTNSNIAGSAASGTVDQIGAIYDADFSYAGVFDYTFQDARLLTVTVDTTKNVNGGNIPVAIQADLIAVIQSRLIDILAAYLPVGTAFMLDII